MKEETIRGFNGQAIGTIERYPNGDEIVREWPSKKILGKYRAADNVTLDFYGRVIGRGNMVVSLLYKK